MLERLGLALITIGLIIGWGYGGPLADNFPDSQYKLPFLILSGTFILAGLVIEAIYRMRIKREEKELTKPSI